MKKHLLASVAVLLAIGIQSFTILAPKPKPSGLYWFQISGQHGVSDQIPMSHATFIQQLENPPAGSGCNGAQTYVCVAGFAEGQVNTSTNTLINDSQTAQTVAHKKPN